MKYNDIFTLVRQTSVADQEIVTNGDYFVGFDIKVDRDCTLIFWGEEHQIETGVFSVPISDGYIRSLKIKESDVIYTLYAGVVYGSGN